MLFHIIKKLKDKIYKKIKVDVKHLALLNLKIPVVLGAAAERLYICCTCSHWCGFHRELGSANTMSTVTLT